jgi:hypothetical protein
MRYKNPTPNPLPASDEGAKMYLIGAETAVPKIALIKMVITQAKLIMILNIIPKNCLFDLFPCYNHLMGRKSGL